MPHSVHHPAYGRLNLPLISAEYAHNAAHKTPSSFATKIDPQAQSADAKLNRKNHLLRNSPCEGESISFTCGSQIRLTFSTSRGHAGGIRLLGPGIPDRLSVGPPARAGAGLSTRHHSCVVARVACIASQWPHGATGSTQQPAFARLPT